jgi:hypothetical protein
VRNRIFNSTNDFDAILATVHKLVEQFGI